MMDHLSPGVEALVELEHRKLWRVLVQGGEE